MPEAFLRSLHSIPLAQPVNQPGRGTGILVCQVSIIIKALRCLSKLLFIHVKNGFGCNHQQAVAVREGHLYPMRRHGGGTHAAHGLIAAPDDAGIAQRGIFLGHVLTLAGINDNVHIVRHSSVFALEQRFHGAADDARLHEILTGRLDYAGIACKQRSDQRICKVNRYIAGCNVESKAAAQAVIHLSGILSLERFQIGTAAEKSKCHHIRIGFGLFVLQKRRTQIAQKRHYGFGKGFERPGDGTVTAAQKLNITSAHRYRCTP